VLCLQATAGLGTPSGERGRGGKRRHHMIRALKSKPIALVLGAGALVFALSGCATKTYVGEQVDASKRATDVKKRANCERSGSNRWALT